jgi:hypothetical protein
MEENLISKSDILNSMVNLLTKHVLELQLHASFLQNIIKNYEEN